MATFNSNLYAFCGKSMKTELLVSFLNQFLQLSLLITLLEILKWKLVIEILSETRYLYVFPSLRNRKKREKFQFLKITLQVYLGIILKYSRSIWTLINRVSHLSNISPNLKKNGIGKIRKLFVYYKYRHILGQEDFVKKLHQALFWQSSAQHFQYIV